MFLGALSEYSPSYWKWLVFNLGHITTSATTALTSITIRAASLMLASKGSFFEIFLIKLGLLPPLQSALPLLALVPVITAAVALVYHQEKSYCVCSADDLRTRLKEDLSDPWFKEMADLAEQHLLKSIRENSEAAKNIVAEELRKEDERYTHRYKPLSGIAAKQEGRAESRGESRSAKEINMVDV